MSLRNRIAPTAMLLAIVAPACATEDAAPEQRVFATLAGSERAAELGVSYWEVRSEGDGARVTGLDERHQRRAELVVMPDEQTENRVHVEAVFPERGRFDLARGGAVDGAASPLLHRLGAAVTADMGEGSVPIETVAADGLGTTSSASTLQNSGGFDVGWSMFPHAGNVLVGNQCPGMTRDFGEASALFGGATCTFNGWFSSASNDCRFTVHYTIGGFNWDRCTWRAFVQ
jgi:hypothetical protein